MSGAEAIQTPIANGSGAIDRPNTGFGMMAETKPKPMRAARVSATDQADQPAVQEIGRGPADHAATGSRTRTAPFGPSTTTSAACSTPSVTSR